MTLNPVSLGTWEAYPGLGYGLVLFETLLGFWLIAGIAPFASWLASVLTFSGFAAMSGRSVWLGQATCDCLGSVQTNPWWMFGVDLIILSLLIIARPIKSYYSRRTFTSMIRQLSVICGPALVLALFGTSSIFLYGSIAAGICRLRGDSLMVDEFVNLGIGEPNQILRQIVHVTNLTNQPIRLIGGASDCSCATAQGLPLTIPARETRSVHVQIKVQQSDPGEMTRNVTWNTDCEVQRTIHTKIRYRTK